MISQMGLCDHGGLPVVYEKVPEQVLYIFMQENMYYKYIADQSLVLFLQMSNIHTETVCSNATGNQLVFPSKQNNQISGK